MKTMFGSKLFGIFYYLIIVFFLVLPFFVYYFVNSLFFKTSKNQEPTTEIFVAEPALNNFNFKFKSANNEIRPNEEKTINVQVESTNASQVSASLVTATVKIPAGVDIVTKQVGTNTVVDKSKTKGLVADTLINLVEYDSAKRELSFIFISDIENGSKFNFNTGLTDIAQITLKTASTTGSFKINFATGESAVNSVSSDTATGTVNYLNLASLANFIDLTVAGTTTPSENVLPVSSITAPQNGAIYSPSPIVGIDINAIDSDGTVTKVEFYNVTNSPEVLLGQDTTAPYSFNWNNVPAGTYRIRGKATDSSGGIKATENDVTFTVSAVPTITVNPTVDAGLLQIEIKLQNKETSTRKYALPNVLVAVFDKTESKFESQIVPISKDGKITVNNQALVQLFRKIENTQNSNVGYLIVKPESYLSKVSLINKSASIVTGQVYVDPFIAGDAIIDTGSFDIVNVRDYVLLKSYYLNDIYDFDSYFFDYNGDNKITIADLGPARNNYGNMGGVASLKDDTTFTSLMIESIISKMRNAMESVMYKVTPI